MILAAKMELLLLSQIFKNLIEQESTILKTE